MSEGWAGWLAERHVEEPPAAKIYRQAMQAAGRQDRAELAAEVEQAAAAEDARDARLLAFRQVGIAGKSLEETFAEAARIGDEDQEYEAAAATMARIERRRQRRVEATRSEMAQLAAVASRSAPADPFEAATRRAHEAFTQVTRARLAGVQATAAERGRPFVRRGVAVARRNEPVTCEHCLAVGADATESFLIHHPDADGNPLSVVTVPVPPVLPDDADRDGRAHRAGERVAVPADYGVITRICGPGPDGRLANSAPGLAVR